MTTWVVMFLLCPMGDSISIFFPPPTNEKEKSSLIEEEESSRRTISDVLMSISELGAVPMDPMSGSEWKDFRLSAPFSSDGDDDKTMKTSSNNNKVEKRSFWPLPSKESDAPPGAKTPEILNPEQNKNNPELPHRSEAEEKALKDFSIALTHAKQDAAALGEEDGEGAHEIKQDNNSSKIYLRALYSSYPQLIWTVFSFGVMGGGFFLCLCIFAFGISKNAAIKGDLKNDEDEEEISDEEDNNNHEKSPK